MSRGEIRKYQDKREQQQHDRINRVLEAIVKRIAEPQFGDPQALMEFEEVRIMALSTYPPQCNAAVNATLAKCRVMGMLVERHAIGRPSEFAAREEEEAAIYQRMVERLGKTGADKFMEFADKLRAAATGKLIDGEAEEIGDE